MGNTFNNIIIYLFICLLTDQKCLLANTLQMNSCKIICSLSLLLFFLIMGCVIMSLSCPSALPTC